MILTLCIPAKLGTCCQDCMSSGPPPLWRGTPSAFAVAFTMTLTFHSYFRDTGYTGEMRLKLFYGGKCITAKEVDTLAAKLAKPSSTSEMSMDEENAQPKKAYSAKRVKKEERSKEVDITV